MFETTVENLVKHLRHDMGLAENSLVWLHSGVIGLGVVRDGFASITEAFSQVVPSGALVIPTFTYSWCDGRLFNPYSTECPKMGGYASVAWKDERFSRNSNPNFSVAVMDQTEDKKVEKLLLSDETKWTCFGRGSVFDYMERLGADMPAHIILLGGAHNDVVFRSTFVHLIEERVGVPYRWLKYFVNPENSHEKIEQYVRYHSVKEYCRQTEDQLPPAYWNFPVMEKYEQLGHDIQLTGLITVKKFGYSQTRMVSIPVFCEWLENKLQINPEYLLG